jgi:isochorismate synthase
MELTLLLKKITDHHINKLPFVLYALPDSDTATVLFQPDATLHVSDSLEERGFVFAPFNFDKSAYYIPEEGSEIISIPITKEDVEVKALNFEEDPEDYERHIRIVKEAKRLIHSREALKIVVSRKKEINLVNNSLLVLIPRILNLYPTAFRYIFYHPLLGVWCGASPETLLEIESKSFSTMALAGTQIINKKRSPDWSRKEIEEQQFVTDAISTSLQKVTSVLKISKTYTHTAGSLAHLRTDLSGVLKNGKATLYTIASALHPTPAVCGTPKKIAKRFIQENEEYDREFYTGFLGPVNFNKDSSMLFVNLRCMKIEEQKATLYVGGGITDGSIAINEWEETHNKLQTMLQVLQPLL